MDDKKVVIRESGAEQISKAANQENKNDIVKESASSTKKSGQNASAKPVSQGAAKQASKKDAFNSAKLTIDGYHFYTIEDAEIAAAEQKKIEFLAKKLNFSNPASVHQIYEKLVEERMFKTPVGLTFLKRLQNYLMESPSIDNSKVTPIPLNVVFNGGIREQGNRTRQRIQPSQKKDKKVPALAISVILNLMLVAAVVAMFGIAVTADEPNILNYERAITNRYASWEQELTEREQAVREKERALEME